MPKEILKPLTILSLISTNTPALASDNHLSIYYVPWVLVILSLLTLIPVLLIILNFKKNNKLNDSKRIDKWRSLLIFPTFVGSIGVSLTIFPLIFTYLGNGDKQILSILIPLVSFCILFIAFTKKGYSLLKTT